MEVGVGRKHFPELSSATWNFRWRPTDEVGILRRQMLAFKPGSPLRKFDRVGSWAWAWDMNLLGDPF